MATFNHSKMFVYYMALKDIYHLPEAPRNSPGMAVDAELLEARGYVLFNTIQLCTVISNGCSADSVKKYLEHNRNDEKEFQEIVDQATPVLYYAIERNSLEVVTLLLDYGYNPEVGTDAAHFIPALAFAVIHGHIHLQDTTAIVKLLLAGGADPKTIPQDIWRNYLQRLSETWSSQEEHEASSLTWCDASVRITLARGLNLSQRYYLHRANLCKPFTVREDQQAELHQAKGLMNLPYHRPTSRITRQAAARSQPIGLESGISRPSCHGVCRTSRTWQNGARRTTWRPAMCRTHKHLMRTNQVRYPASRFTPRL